MLKILKYHSFSEQNWTILVDKYHVDAFNFDFGECRICSIKQDIWVTNWALIEICGNKSYIYNGPHLKDDLINSGFKDCTNE